MFTATPTLTRTATNTRTPTRTKTPTATPRVSKTATFTNTPTITLTPSNTPTITETFTATPVPPPSETPVPLPTDTEIATSLPTDTETATPEVTDTETPIPLPSEIPTETATWDGISTFTETPLPTEIATETLEPVPTQIPTETDVPVETDTPEFVETPTETATAEFSETPTETATLEVTPTETATPEPTPTSTPTLEPGRAEYTYDGNGTMVRSIIGEVVSYYPFSSYQVKTDGTNWNTRKYYSFGSTTIAMRENSLTLTWLLSDQINSTTLTAAADGSFLAEIRYTSFGEQRYASGQWVTDNLYTGQRQETEISLDYYVARFYDPVLAHFVQADSIIPTAGSTRGFDRYAYVMNNPVNFIDPGGNKPSEKDDFEDWVKTRKGTSVSVTVTSNSDEISISRDGVNFIKQAENGNRGIYDDGNNACTIGYGSVLHNGPCNKSIDVYTATIDGVYGQYVNDKWGDPWKLQVWDGKDGNGNPIYGLSRADAEELMRKELAIQGEQIKTILVVQLTQYQWDALQSFVYQTGKYSVVSEKINTGYATRDYSDVIDYMMLWRDDPINSGLDNRRNQERQLFLVGDYNYMNDPYK